MKLSEVKEHPSSPPASSSVLRNSTDLGGGDTVKYFSGVFLLEALLCFHHTSLKANRDDYS